MILSLSEAIVSEDDDSADDEDDLAKLYSNILADCLTEAEQDETEA